MGFGGKTQEKFLDSWTPFILYQIPEIPIQLYMSPCPRLFHFPPRQISRHVPGTHSTSFHRIHRLVLRDMF